MTDEKPKSKEGHWLKIANDHEELFPIYRKDDFLLIQQRDPKNGDHVVVRLSDGRNKIGEIAGNHLKSLNPKIDTVLPLDDVKIVGVITMGGREPGADKTN